MSFDEDKEKDRNTAAASDKEKDLFADYELGQPRTLEDVDEVVAHEIIQKKRYELQSVSKCGINGIDLDEDKPVTTAYLLPSCENCDVFKQKVQMVLLHQLCDLTLTALAESHGVINSNPLATPLFVLRTAGDGNCLAHACSLLVWGVHDFDNTLRKCIEATMTGKSLVVEQIHARYRCELNRMRQSMEICAATSEEVDMELVSEIAVFDAAAAGRNRFLGAVHIFVLSSCLKRPIIVYSTAGAIAEGLSGIFLPLLCEASLSARAPLPLLFMDDHFSALCAQNCDRLLLPLSIRGNNLPIRFKLNEDESDEAMLANWMNVQEIDNEMFAVVEELALEPSLALLQQIFVDDIAAKLCSNLEEISFENDHR